MFSGVGLQRKAKARDNNDFYNDETEDSEADAPASPMAKRGKGIPRKPMAKAKGKAGAKKKGRRSSVKVNFYLKAHNRFQF